MPEGDTIHRLAVEIGKELENKRIRTARHRETGALGEFAHYTVQKVRALGKHLILSIDSGWSVRTHLGMYGDVHRYKKGQRWKKPGTEAVFYIENVEGVEFVWFEPAQVELVPTKKLRTHPKLSRLGPDLLETEVEIDEILKRALSTSEIRGQTYTIGELLLDQSVAAGIGNIYKNEVLFIEGINPGTPANTVDEEKMKNLYERAEILLKKNVQPGPRKTREGSGQNGEFLMGEPMLWVYGRAGHRCLRCGFRVKKVRQGTQKRLSFYCPVCQPQNENRRS